MTHTPEHVQINLPADELALDSPPVVPPYYRAKTFKAYSGVNPLTAAAAPIISLLPRLRLTKRYEALENLRSNLIHEILAFQSSARRQRYSDHQTGIALYLLCLSADNVIMHSHWDNIENWRPITEYFIKKSHLSTPDEQFYHLIQTCLNQPEKYLHILELAYVCIGLGYQANTLHHANTDQDWLAALSNRIYQSIHQLRKKRKTNVTPHVVKNTHGLFFHNLLKFPIKSFLIVSLLGLSAMYFGGKYIQSFTEQSVQHQLTQVKHFMDNYHAQ